MRHLAAEPWVPDLFSPWVPGWLDFEDGITDAWREAESGAGAVLDKPPRTSLTASLLTQAGVY